jgi:hypothetical protein
MVCSGCEEKASKIEEGRQLPSFHSRSEPKFLLFFAPAVHSWFAAHAFTFVTCLGRLFADLARTRSESPPRCPRLLQA